jgi:hypothetical protein
MPVNGLLLTLSPDSGLADEALARITARAEVSLGEPQGRWQAIAVDTPDVKTAHDFHEWLEALPGVEQVDVIYVGFDEFTLSETAP